MVTARTKRIARRRAATLARGQAPPVAAQTSAAGKTSCSGCASAAKPGGCDCGHDDDDDDDDDDCPWKGVAPC